MNTETRKIEILAFIEGAATMYTVVYFHEDTAALKCAIDLAEAKYLDMPLYRVIFKSVKKELEK